MLKPDEVLAFWLDEIGPKGWYAGGDALDRQVRDFAEDTWDRAMDGACALWLTHPSGVLAYSILMDQFPRNMFRDTAKAFASDCYALAAVKMAIHKNWDLKIDEPARQFFYMPIVHSESLVDQDRAVRLFVTRMPEHGKDFLLHAKAHREIIRTYGRFPTRNKALGRCSRPVEENFVNNQGYGYVVEALRAGNTPAAQSAQAV